MYNTKFTLDDGREIYPGYMDKERCLELKEEYGDRKGYMECGCRVDKKLFYRISEDLRIYPEHNNYIHDINCSRYRNEKGEIERKTAYVVGEEDGEVKAYLAFSPKNLATKEEIEKDENNPSLDQDDLEKSEDEAVIEKEKGVAKNAEKKEPKLSLASLVRSINIDTFTEKMLNDKKIDSRVAFSRLVYHRMKKIRANRMKKSLGELTMESDGVRFVYSQLAGVTKKDGKGGLTKCYVQTYGPDGKIFDNFIFPETLAKAVKEFAKKYGIEPNEDSMMAGFQYYKKSNTDGYRVLGRIHFFQVSDLGLYCRSLVEKTAYDSIANIVNGNKNLKFWIPPDDESVGGIIDVRGKRKKILILFRTTKDERVSINTSLYEPVIIGENEPLTKDRLEQIIDQMA